MAHHQEKADSEFYREFPAVDSVWYSINTGRKTLNDMPEEFSSIPLNFRNAKKDLEYINEQKAAGTYKEYANCTELKEIIEALQDVIDRLELKARELNIKVDEGSWRECREFENCELFLQEYGFDQFEPRFESEP